MEMAANKKTRPEETSASGGGEELFYLGLKYWEDCKTEPDFVKAKNLISEAKSKRHPLGDMYWDIICAFEEAGYAQGFDCSFDDDGCGSN